MKRQLPSGTVDFHTHILPVDHGSRNTAMAVEQWGLLREAGLAAVVATPHFSPHEEASVAAFLDRRDAAAGRLLSRVEGGPLLYLGAEVLVFPGLEELPDLSRLCIGGSGILLLELPLGGWSREHLDTLDAIAAMGITPLIAHIDRYALSALDTLYEHPDFLFQVNLGSLRGLGARARYFRRMLRAGAIAALGSDLHGVPRSGYAQSLRVLLRAGAALETVNSHTAELLAAATPFTVK